jgi:ribosomal-protein-alanine N-acetyltransferase
VIRPAGPGDVPAVAALERQAFGDRAWSEGLVAEEVARPDAVVLLEEGPGGLDGYLGLRVAAGIGEIFTLAVHPDRRRTGVASGLLASAEEIARARGAEAVHLEVSEGNGAARALYAGRGYREVGRRRGYYGTSEDAILMTLPLGSDSPRGVSRHFRT